MTTEPGDLLWQISSESEPDVTPTNRIRSGVTYGTVPELAQESGDGAVPLSAGQAYRVILHVIDSQGHTTLVGQGLFEAPAE